MKKMVLVSVALCAFGIIFSSLAINPASAKADKFRKANRPIPNRYIVVLADDFAATVAGDEENGMGSLAREFHGDLRRIYKSALHGFATEMSAEDAFRLSQDARIKFVEEDAQVSIDTTETGATWSLDRLDQHALPLDTTYTYDRSGVGVNAYVLDTGIRITHTEFGGRADVVFDSVGDGQNGIDCNGHGTHVSGTIGGTRYGVAKSVSLHSVRVMNCSGSGEVSGVVAGVDWVTAHAAHPAVANMSLGGDVSTALDSAVANSVASGVTYSIAAGNNNMDACQVSPAHVPSAMTVAASDQNDQRAFFSNWGSCVDIFAPGYTIASAWITNDDTYAYLSGTSMAAPHVAGVAAQYLQADPTASPNDVRNAIIQAATTGVILDPAGTPNLLLFSAFGVTVPSPTPTPTPTPTPIPTPTPTPTPTGCSGTSLSGSVTTGGSQYQSSVNGFNGGTGTYEGSLSAPVGSQFSLSLERKKGTRWSTLASSPGTGASETLQYKGKSGTYRWRVTAVSGGGSYSLCDVHPN